MVWLYQFDMIYNTVKEISLKNYKKATALWDLPTNIIVRISHGCYGRAER